MAARVQLPLFLLVLQLAIKERGAWQASYVPLREMEAGKERRKVGHSVSIPFCL